MTSTVFRKPAWPVTAKLCLKSPGLKAAAFAAIFFFSQSAAAQSFRRMSHNIVASPGGFQNLVATICWLGGAYLCVHGAFIFFRKEIKNTKD